MCSRCHEYVVKEMDVKDSDLPGLPFSLVKWNCIFSGCSSSNKRVRDYGVPGYLFDPVKRRELPLGWRGGWFLTRDHVYACSKHWHLMDQNILTWPECTAEDVLSKLVPLDKNLKPKKKKKNDFLF